MHHIEVVAAIIVNDYEVLCMQRGPSKHYYLSGKFEFPGGKIDHGESRTQALSRELKEELDLELTIRDSDFFMTINHIYPDFEITMHSYVCKVDSREFKRIEHIDHKWMQIEDLKSLDWAMADMPIVVRIIDGKLSGWI